MANVGCITLVHAIFEHCWHFRLLARTKRANSLRPDSHEERRYGILEKRERCT
ncbi:hypothetical protein BJV77DRAFT_989968 [Russula vinacea]|nr:hypothetical protein BJV77DRAFT_989968 [Russula vinacea]